VPLTPLRRIFCRQLYCYEYFAMHASPQTFHNNEFTPKT
jgi:hypothetical protein